MNSLVLVFSTAPTGLHHSARLALDVQFYAGFALDEEVFSALFVAYDPQRRKALDLTEFLGVQLFLKAASGMFHVFDYQRSGCISLDFNQFIYACTFCR